MSASSLAELQVSDVSASVLDFTIEELLDELTDILLYLAEIHQTQFSLISYILKMKKISWCWKFIVAKRGKEDVLMTELWTPLICVC